MTDPSDALRSMTVSTPADVARALTGPPPGEDAVARLRAALSTPDAMARLTAALRDTFDAIREAFRPFVEAMAAAARKITGWVESMRERFNDPVYVAGLEGRYFVRAGLDPAYATPESLSRLVRGVLAGDLDGEPYDAPPFLFLLSGENRRRVAVAAMRGWETRGERLTSWTCGDWCQEALAVGMPASCSPVVRWRCEHYNPPEPPLVAHRLWGTARVEVSCG